MADSKVSALTTIAGAAVDVDNDRIYIVDTSAGSSGSKAISPKELIANTACIAQSGSGAVSRTVAEKLQSGVPLEPQDFMTAAEAADVAAFTYGQNVTAALLAFFTACIAQKHPGYIGPGGYLITKGVLAFSCAFTDTPWPVIKTAGYASVIFRATASTDAPFLSITNGTADSAVGKYWRGGELGGISFQDTSGAVATSAHGLRLTGVWGTKFGWMRGDDLRADLVNIPEALFSVTNPDPYAVSNCEFQGIDAEDCVGWGLGNHNFVGFTGCKIGMLRVIRGGLGAWKGFGSGNVLFGHSIGSTSGWAFDDTTTSTGGTGNRVKIFAGECDNVENGIRCNFTDLFEIETRFIHRFQTSPNADADYWPRTAVDLASTGSPSVTAGKLKIWHRLESGGVLADLGEFVDGHSDGNINNVEIDMEILDSGGLAPADTDLYTGIITSNATVAIKRAGKRINDQMVKVASVVRGSAAGTALTIGADPIATTNTSTTVTVTMTGHGLVANQCFTLQGAALTNNVPAAELNRSHFVTSVVDANNVTIVVETAANATGSGGGAGCTAAKDRSFLNIVGSGTAKCKLALPTETSDRGAYYDPVLYQFTVPFTGLYRVFAKIRWTGLAAGNRVRMAVYANIHTSPSIVSYSEMRCQGANAETLQVHDVVLLTAGTLLSVNCDCNAAAALAMSFVGANDVGFSVEAL